MDLALMDYSDLVALQTAVNAEVQRRDTLTAAESQLARLAADVHKAKGGTDGETWVQPVTLGYPQAVVVQAASGDYYRSLVGNNVWTPGDTSAHGAWEQVWADGAGGWVTKDPDASGPRQWIPDMQVAVGDLVVCDGWIWVAKVAHRTHVGWRPSDAAYAVWDKVRAVDEPKRAES